jgi:hypothetical protein
MIAAALFIAIAAGTTTACGVLKGGGNDATPSAPTPDATARAADRRTAPQAAEADDSADIPGTFVPSQGRLHFGYIYTPSAPEPPFCPGVPHANNTPVKPDPEHRISLPLQQDGRPIRCYASNPPSSGTHFNVQSHVDLGNGDQINIPPDIGVYPAEIEIPRGVIPHILEHAGVFVGWNCAGGDTNCQAAEQKLEEVVRGRIDVDQDRVVMAHDNDLVPGTFGLSSWTRVMDFSYKKYDSKAVTAFISKNSCRVDFEGFCG